MKEKSAVILDALAECPEHGAAHAAAFEAALDGLKREVVHDGRRFHRGIF